MTFKSTGHSSRIDRVYVARDCVDGMLFDIQSNVEKGWGFNIADNVRFYAFKRAEVNREGEMFDWVYRTECFRKKMDEWRRDTEGSGIFIKEVG